MYILKPYIMIILYVGIAIEKNVIINWEELNTKRINITNQLKIDRL